MRDINNYQLNYAENLRDDRVDNLRTLGKEHNSVIDGMLFPISTLRNVVPSILHIHLGIVLELYEELESVCQYLDLHCSKKNKKVANAKLNKLKNDIKNLKNSQFNIQTQMFHTSGEILDIENIISRLRSILEVDYHLSLDGIVIGISGNEDTINPVHKCYSPVCVISQYDINRAWLQCEHCENWVHQVCECLTGVEGSYFESSDEGYQCLKCQGIESSPQIMEHLEHKLKNFNLELNALKRTEVDYQKQIDEKEGLAHNEMGPLEKKLNKALKELKVERQAYHQHVFVGNHCEKILHNYEVLCNVLNKHPKEKAKCTRIFKVFSGPRDLLFAKRFLNSDEIKKVVSEVEEFCNIFPILSENNLTPKMHFYSFDVPRFLKEHK